jgi:hypothetical protein
MKHALVLTLLFTLIFPPHCFASLPNNKLLIDENVAIEIMWILEDGIIDSEEMDHIISIYHPGDFCKWSLKLIMSTTFGAVAVITFGGSWSPEASALIATLIINAHVVCNILGDKDFLIPIPKKFQPN